MEPDILLAKMESLSRCIIRIEEKTPKDISILKSDPDIQDILVVNLERAVQQSVDAGLPILVDYSRSRVNSMAEVFTALQENGVIPPDVAKRSSRLQRHCGTRIPFHRLGYPLEYIKKPFAGLQKLSKGSDGINCLRVGLIRAIKASIKVSAAS